jgi:hypothetical protein
MSSSDRGVLFLTTSRMTVSTARTANYTGTAFDTKDYEGSAKVIVDVGAVSGTTPTLDLKLQESDTSGGSYTDIAGATAAQMTATGVAEINYNANQAKRWIRVAGTITGTSPSFANSELFVGFKKYQ